MAQNGFRNGNASPRGTGGQQKLNIVPAQPAAPAPAAPAAPVNTSSNRSGRLKSLWHFICDHKMGTALATIGLPLALVSHTQINREHPEHSLTSLEGAGLRIARVFQNAALATDWAGDKAAAVVNPLLGAADPITARRQPATEAVVCTNAEFYKQLQQKEPRAVAFNAVVQKQFESEMRLLATVDAPFYRKNAHFDPDTQAPAAVFHIPAVPAKFNPSVASYVLPGPVPTPQSEMGPRACGPDEVHRIAPIPGLR